MALQSVSSIEPNAPPSTMTKAAKRLAGQEARHRRLDEDIRTMEAAVNPNLWKIGEAKRKRLAIRDEISLLRRQLGLPKLH